MRRGSRKDGCNREQGGRRRKSGRREGERLSVVVMRRWGFGCRSWRRAEWKDGSSESSGEEEGYRLSKGVV